MGNNPEQDRHIAILGSGSGAFAAAIRAAERGARVTLIEAAEAIGGTCVNVGCVPSKIALRAADTAHRAAHHPFAGVPRAEGPVDRAALLHQIQDRVTELRRSKYEGILADNPAIDLMRGRARLIDAATVEVATENGTHYLESDRILIATGAAPAVPPIPGLAETPWWSSEEALFTATTPDHLAVIGGSSVAVEIAQAFRRLGSAVTILARSRLLSGESPEVGEALEAAFADEGIRVLRETRAERVDHDGQRFTLDTGGERITADRLLVATGRAPNTAGLGLDNAGVALDERGGIRVDDRLRTSTEGVFAVGDCTELPQLVYVAAAAGTRAAVNMTGGDAVLDLSVVPAVIFTNPQVATVGWDEEQARRAGVEAVSRRLELDQVPRALANFDTRGFVRLIADAADRRLLGARVVAPDGGELIQAAALGVRNRMTVDQLADELFPYLTLNEALKLCAQTFTRDVSELSCCAG